MQAETHIIHPPELRRARQAAGLSAAEVEKRLLLPGGTLSRWEEGVDEPDLEHLEGLADLYGRPVDYFLAPRPESPSSVFLRRNARIPATDLSVDLRRTLVDFEELCRTEWELERILGEPQRILFTPQRHITNPASLADFERTRLGLDSQPIEDLRALLGRQGARVFQLPMQEDTAGISWWHGLYGPSILVNLQEYVGRRNFTMAHEYGHLISADTPSDPILCLSQDMPVPEIAPERFADQFAASFLMPANDVRRQWSKSVAGQEEIDAPLLQRLSQRYRVSPQAFAIRLEEIGLLQSARWLLEKVGPIRSFGRRRPDWRRVRGERFVQKALQAHSRERLSLGKLAQFLGTDIRTARKLSTSAPND